MARGGFRARAGRPRTVFEESYSERYYHKHKEKIQEKRKQKLDYAKAYRIKCIYGISREEYNRMLQKHNGVCAICKCPETLIQRGKTQNLSIDHCHKTGAIRGLICNNCNIMLGRAKDSVTVLEAAIVYLKGSM